MEICEYLESCDDWFVLLVCCWCALISLSFGWSASVDNLGGIQSKSVKMCPYITVGICLKTPLKIMQSRSVEKRLRLGQERCYVDVFLEWRALYHSCAEDSALWLCHAVWYTVRLDKPSPVCIIQLVIQVLSHSNFIPPLSTHYPPPPQFIISAELCLCPYMSLYNRW